MLNFPSRGNVTWNDGMVQEDRCAYQRVQCNYGACIISMLRNRNEKENDIALYRIHAICDPCL